MMLPQSKSCSSTKWLHTSATSSASKEKNGSLNHLHEQVGGSCVSLFLKTLTRPISRSSTKLLHGRYPSFSCSCRNRQGTAKNEYASNGRWPRPSYASSRRNSTHDEFCEPWSRPLGQGSIFRENQHQSSQPNPPVPAITLRLLFYRLYRLKKLLKRPQKSENFLSLKNSFLDIFESEGENRDFFI